MRITFPVDVAAVLCAEDSSGAAALGIRGVIVDDVNGLGVDAEPDTFGLLRVYPKAAPGAPVYHRREMGLARAVALTSRYLRIMGAREVGGLSPIARVLVIWRHERGLSKFVARALVRQAVVNRYKEKTRSAS